MASEEDSTAQRTAVGEPGCSDHPSTLSQLQLIGPGNCALRISTTEKQTNLLLSAVKMRVTRFTLMRKLAAGRKCSAEQSVVREVKSHLKVISYSISVGKGGVVAED